jgi:centromere protein I
VIKVVGSLGHGKAKASFAAQAALLKWLIMVYDFLENPRIFSRLYSILFNLLDTIAIRFDDLALTEGCLLTEAGLHSVTYFR